MQYATICVIQNFDIHEIFEAFYAWKLLSHSYEDDFFHVNDFNEGNYSLTLISILIFCWKKIFNFEFLNSSLQFPKP